MRRHLVFAAGLTLLLATLPSRAQELPPDLAAVPGSAVGFVHVRIAEVWKGDALKDIRAILAKAGPKYLDMLDQRFVPAPSTVDRVTLIVTLDQAKGEPSVVAVVTTSQPFDREKLLKNSLPSAKEQKAGETTYYVDGRLNVAVQVPSDRMLVFGPEAVLKSYLTRSEKGHGVFAAALKEAAGKNPITVAVNAAALPAELLAQTPPPARALLKAGLIQLSVEPGIAPTLDIRLGYEDAAAADSAEKSLKDLLGMAKQQLAEYRKEAEEKLFSPKKDKRSSIEDLPEAAASLAALGFIAQAEEILGDFPLKRDGNALAARVKVPEGPFGTAVSTAGVAVGLLLPAVQKVREAAGRTQSQNNLKQLNLAIINYADTYNGLPPAAICDKKGKPILSWRVAILPYIEQDNLYKQFHLDEPWDSEHNIKLARAIPRTYVRAIDKIEGDTVPKTHYLAFVGNGAAWELKGGLKYPASIPDGTSNTIWLAESEEGVPWSKPEDFEYDPKKMPKIGFGWSGGNYTNVGFADGSVRTLSRSLAERTWHLLIQRADGQPLPPDFDK
jgi:prepilin-type processing-associated H-X9-DG protein